MRPGLKFCSPSLDVFKSSTGSTAVDAIVKVCPWRRWVQTQPAHAAWCLLLPNCPC